MDFEIDELGGVGEFPRWREVIKIFLDSRFKEDDIIEHSWFYDAFWIERPEPDTPCEKADKLRLAFLGQFTPFRNSLLRDHQIDLATVPGVGYRITPPAKQSALAYADGVDDIKKGLRKMLTRVANVNLEGLTIEQRKENAETLCKAAMLRGMVRKTKRLSDSE